MNFEKFFRAVILRDTWEWFFLDPVGKYMLETSNSNEKCMTSIKFSKRAIPENTCE